ncbi:deoxycytidylate deaminase-like, partial [Neolamprologus brichardi]|uniref:deoxycytidylate deaminase-like n=1 Tax=Neolamprologus brichardi TaxID=32507 RepID=UPI001643A7CD
FLYSGKTKKREDYLEWPEYFMAVAFLSAQRSKDPSSQVGACIVNQENKIVGIGYNGMPNGCSLKEVVYLSDKYHDTPEMTASRRLLSMAKIEYRQFKPKRTEIVIDFSSINFSGALNGATK